MIQLSLEIFGLTSQPTKRCSQCKQHKTLDHFCKDKHRPDGKAIHCKECVKMYNDLTKERRRRLRKENPDKYRNAEREYYFKNHDRCRESRKKHYKDHRDKYIELSRIHYETKREYCLQRQREYNKTSNGILAKKRDCAKRKLLGFNPVNTYFGGAEYHHFRSEIYGYKDNDIGIYIPAKLHHSIWHNGNSGQGMKEINKAALLWLAEQAVI